MLRRTLFQLTSSPPFHIVDGEEIRMDIRLKPVPSVERIRVTKVYDQCVQTDVVQNVCAPLPELPGPLISLACIVTGTGCTFQGSQPTSRPAISDVSFVVALQISFVLETTAGTVTVPATVVFPKTVQLCTPPGTAQDCDVMAAGCGPLLVIGNSVCTTVQVCTAFTSEGEVRLLVPSFGSVAPAICVAPQSACPPPAWRQGC